MKPLVISFLFMLGIIIGTVGGAAGIDKPPGDVADLYEVEAVSADVLNNEVYTISKKHEIVPIGYASITKAYSYGTELPIGSRSFITDDLCRSTILEDEPRAVLLAQRIDTGPMYTNTYSNRQYRMREMDSYEDQILDVS